MGENTSEIISKHQAGVQLKLERLILELNKRCRTHDNSKLQEPEYSLWKKMDEEQRCPYGTKEYFDKIERNKKVFDLHYKNNNHHPEHYENGILDMDLVDIMEMLCDWISYKDCISYSEAKETILNQAKRFGIDAQLIFLLLNTINNYFVSFGSVEKNPHLKDLKEKLHLD